MNFSAKFPSKVCGQESKDDLQCPAFAEHAQGLADPHDGVDARRVTAAGTGKSRFFLQSLHDPSSVELDFLNSLGAEFCKRGSYLNIR